jgi:NIMA (never in mitosis gene a)-related kinase
LELLNHQNIVKFKEVYRTAKMKLNIVMEYAEGGDLFQRIKTAKQTMSYFSEE